ncbi:hypothetical protein, partial [Klebsiella pneumoniae]|uniref:hypothetical protein n=1 Tax=Klebsiella pneumoniae TaxID=573 RepID=UPI00405594D7
RPPSAAAISSFWGHIIIPFRYRTSQLSYSGERYCLPKILWLINTAKPLKNTTLPDFPIYYYMATIESLFKLTYNSFGQ